MANVTVEEVGPCKKLLKISVPNEEIQEKLDESYEKLRQSVQIDGFRMGHAPRKLLERRFGEKMLEEVKQTVMSESSSTALEEHSLTALGEPSFDNVEFELGEDFNFDVTIEVKPEVELGEYKGLKLTRKSHEVTDEDVASALEDLRTRWATLEPVSDAEVQPGDHVICEWEVTCEEETVANERESEIVALGKRFGDMEVDDLGELLKGAKKGDERTGKVKFSQEFQIEKYRGKEGELRLDIRGIKRPVKPELTDELAKKADFDSLDELKEEVRTRLQAEKGREVEEDMRNQIRRQLLERTPIELPDGLVKKQAKDILVREQLRLTYMGVDREMMQERLNDLRAASEERAERDFKLFFILENVAEKEKLFVTENDVENRIAALANYHRVTVERMRKRLEEEDSMSQLRAQMREEKTLKCLLDNAEIQDGK